MSIAIRAGHVVTARHVQKDLKAALHALGGSEDSAIAFKRGHIHGDRAAAIADTGAQDFLNKKNDIRRGDRTRARTLIQQAVDELKSSTRGTEDLQARLQSHIGEKYLGDEVGVLRSGEPSAVQPAQEDIKYSLRELKDPIHTATGRTTAAVLIGAALLGAGIAYLVTKNN
jgi:hypothetical protein